MAKADPLTAAVEELKAPLGEPPRAESRRISRILTGLAYLSIWTAAIIALGHFTLRQAWIRPFLRDLRSWLLHPEISGGWQVPYDALLIGLIVVAVMAVAFLMTGLALSNTAFARDTPTRLGLTITIGLAVLGFAGAVAVATGHLDAVSITVFLIVIGSLVVGTWFARGRPAVGLTLRAESRGSKLSLIGWPVAIAIVSLSLIHSAMAPVTEWDAVIYHAGTAKLWFLGRPDPPLLFGPSVGVEISANYPPIFPAIGAAMTTLIGRFDDAYLRLVSPVAFAGLLLLLFGWVRKERGSRTAWLAVIIASGCPLLVMYGAWPTSYMLLSALTLAGLFLVYLAASTASRWGWSLAGIVAGFSMLTHFYGWLVLGFGLCAMLIWQRSRRGGINFAIFVGVAVLVASPWLLRDLIRLQDPVYPLGSPIFHGIGLSQPLWGAAQAEIRQNALGQFGGADVPNLRAYELLAAIFSRHFLPIGFLAPLLFAAWRALRRDRLVTYLGVGLLILFAAQLAPGWYWLRSLVPALAIGAFLGAAAIDAMIHAVNRVRSALGRLGRLIVAATLLATIAISSVVGGLLAFAGPNQDTWTTGLTGSHDMLTAVRNLGSNEKQLWTVYGGDYECWKWLNDHLGAGERVATLDLRLYYFNRPQDLFYLDGEEGVPLLKMSDPSAVADYLQSAGVKYIMIPAWAIAPTPARHPAVDLLPLMKMLGRTGGFPLVASFAGPGSTVPTTVYAVDLLAQTTSLPTVFAGSSAQSPSGSHNTFTFPRGATDPRIYAPTSDTQVWYLSFWYDNTSAGRFDINAYDYRTKKWHLVYREERTGKGGWVDTSFQLPQSTNGWVDLGVYAAGSSLTITELRVVAESSP